MSAALSSASELWLCQLPAGFDARRLVGATLKLRGGGGGGGGELGAMRLRAAAGAAAAARSHRVRLVAEEPQLAAQLYALPAPCAGAQGAC